MCYFITAYVPKDFCTDKFAETCERFHLMPSPVQVSHPELAAKQLVGFRLTGESCDCDWGGKKQRQGQLANCLGFLDELGHLKNAKSITLLKHDYKGDLTIGKDCSLVRDKVHVNDLDEQFLGSIAADVLYEIGLYPRRETTSWL